VSLTTWKQTLAGASICAMAIMATAVPSAASVANTAPEPQTFAEVSSDCALATKVTIVMDSSPKRAQGFDSATRRLTNAPVINGSDCRSRQGKDITTAAVAFGSKTFTPTAPSYARRDTNSYFTAQTTFKTGYPTAFSFSLSSALVLAANGTVTTASAVRSPVNCSYNKPGVAVSYLFHWSCSGQSTGTSYKFTGAWKFPIKLGGVNRPGESGDSVV
jgi:hypothetical protein